MVFNNLWQLHKACVWTLLIHFLNACKSLVLLFLILNTLSKYQFLFFRCKSVYNLKYGYFSLLQIIERFSELRFKYMGSYPSDIVPQLSKYTLAILNSDPSNDRGEHWIMIPQQKKITTLVILWVDRYQFTAF